VSDLDRLIAELGAPQHGVVARRQIRGLGAGDDAVDRRVADRRLRPVYRGVFIVGDRPPSLKARWKAATLALGDDALLSHFDAMALWDLGSVRDGDVHVTAPGRHAEHQPGIRAHRIRKVHEDDRDEVDGIPVTSVARTLLDLAAVAAPIELRRSYERAERLGLLDLEAIADVTQRHSGHRGAKRLRRLLAYDPRAAAGARSELERLFIDLLNAHGVPAPQTNVLVEGFLVDCFWPRANLVVELDGFEFHNDRETFERDRRRIVELRRVGCEVLPLTYAQVTREPAWVIEAVLSALS
jgi:very-short-patch-repair endonuclease